MEGSGGRCGPEDLAYCGELYPKLYFSIHMEI